MPRILLIADLDANREAALQALQGAPFDVLHVPDANTALLLARELDPALLLADLQASAQNGVWLLEQVRQDAKLAAVPVILLADRFERAEHRQAMRLGADDYLVKPYSAQELIESIGTRGDQPPRSRPTQSLAPEPAPSVARSRTPTITIMGTSTPAQIRSASVLFADLRDFDAFAERLSAEELSQLLQKFFSAACEPIVAHAGRVIKFLGGGLLAVFEDDADRAAHARRALIATRALCASADMFRRWVEVRFSDRALPEFRVSCGLHTGEVATSTLSMGSRSEHGVFGEPVHHASLLREAAKELDCDILASEAMLKAAGPGVQIATLHEVAAEGGDSLTAGEVLAVETQDELSLSGSLELPQEIRYALEVNCEVTSRAVKSAALAARSERKPDHRVGKEAPKEDLSAIRLPIKGYKIVAKLGQGGMSSVYLVERDADGLQLALKLLDTRGSDADSLLERFIQEFEVISAICHPNVAAIYDQGVTDEGLFILMEYFERGDLKRRVRKGMTPQQALAALVQVATGLREIHERGVVHRDMKPENLLLRADRTLAVADFGIAKAHAGGVASTAVGALMGTPHYVSPEQVKGKTADARSDLYSLGVIFFEMLTGQRPFRAEQLDQLLAQHVNEAIPQLPKDLAVYQSVINRLMAKDPAQRYQTAAELLDDLSTARYRLTAEAVV